MNIIKKSLVFIIIFQMMISSVLVSTHMASDLTSNQKQAHYHLHDFAHLLSHIGHLHHDHNIDDHEDANVSFTLYVAEHEKMFFDARSQPRIIHQSTSNFFIHDKPPVPPPYLFS